MTYLYGVDWSGTDEYEFIKIIDIYCTVDLDLIESWGDNLRFENFKFLQNINREYVKSAFRSRQSGHFFENADTPGFPYKPQVSET